MAVMMMVVVAMRTKAAMMSDCVNDDVGAYECGVEAGHVDDVLQHTRDMYYNKHSIIQCFVSCAFVFGAFVNCKLHWR